VAEKVRVRLMGIHKRIKHDDPTLVSPLFSGKQPDGTPLEGHRHAFYIPSDEDGDGRIDHLTITSGEPFDADELSALDRLTSIWQPKGRPVAHLVLIALSADPKTHSCKTWVSATPFVTSRHYRKGRGTFEHWLTAELIRECGFHGLPAPSTVEWIPGTRRTKRPIRWFEFGRSRKGDMPAPGYGCIISFENVVHGPFSLGAGCHFGLGAFVPYQDANH
jgi:CRISPR-associated protein Csb2